MVPAGKPGHDLAEDRGVVLGLGLPCSLLDAQTFEIAAQPRQRALVQEPRQIIGTVGQQLAATEADEEIEVLPADALGICPGSGFAERRMRHAERTWIAAQSGQAPQELSVGAARQQRREQRILLRARRIDLVDAVGRFAVEEIRAQHRARHARGRLYRKHALGGDAIPVRNRGLGDADAAREFTDAAYGANRFLEPLIPHLPISWALRRIFRIGTVRNRNANATLPSIAQSYAERNFMSCYGQIKIAQDYGE